MNGIDAIETGHHQRATKSSRLVSRSAHCGITREGPAWGSNTRLRGARIVFFFGFFFLYLGFFSLRKFLLIVVLRNKSYAPGALIFQPGTNEQFKVGALRTSHEDTR